MPANLHSHWRDLKEWRSYGLEFSTASDQAVKLWDAALTQYVGWYDDQSVGGVEKTVQTMIEADPSFAMGRVMSIGLDLMGTARNIRTDPSFKVEIEELDEMTVNSWESKHVEALKQWSKGQCKNAALVWEDILMDHPNDMLALKFAHDHYFYYGQRTEIRDSIARVLPHWKRDMPLYGYLLGMHSFGLCETNMLAEAEVVAKKGLELNSQDAWSTHSMAHVYEIQGRSKEGIAFMSETMKDWSQCGMLACHNFWHWSLYHIERNEHQTAVDIFDDEISKRCRSGAMLDLVDACSVLYRLELEGVKVGQERWEQVYEVCRPHQDEHVTSFNDVHILMSYLGARKTDMTQKLMDSIRTYIENFSEEEDMAGLGKEIGWSLCQALSCYDAGDYDGAVQDLWPLKYDIVRIGGSNAQRDVFNLLLINSAMKSKDYQNLCRSLIFERKALKKDSPLTERLTAKWMERHEYKPVSRENV